MFDSQSLVFEVSVNVGIIELEEGPCLAVDTEQEFVGFVGLEIHQQVYCRELVEGDLAEREAIT